MRTVIGSDIVDTANKKMSPILIEVASDLNDLEFVFKIDDLLETRGLTQRDLSDLTGIPIGAVTDWVGGKSGTINKVHLMSLLNALRVTDISELFEVKLPEDTEKQFKKDAKEWTKNQDMPESVKDIYKNNMQIKMEKL